MRFGSTDALIAASYCRPLAMRQTDFARLISANPDAREAIQQVPAARQAMNTAIATPSAASQA